MREILFRGKRLDNGKWVEGGYYREDYTDNVYITFWNSFGLGFMDSCQVDTATVGQYTGLMDKNGKRIFEGDVVKQTFVKTVPAIHDEIGWDDFDDLYGEDVGAVVIIPSKGVCIKNPVIHREVNGEVTEHGETARMYKNVCSVRCEVIGNIHDNPELLQEVHGA